jgi:hypothetical protein
MQNNKTHKVKKARPGSTGSKHWNYQHGNETLAAKKHRSERSLRLRYLQDIGHQLNFMAGRRMAGRKPVNFLVLDYKNKEHLAYVVKIIDSNQPD